MSRDLTGEFNLRFEDHLLGARQAMADASFDLLLITDPADIAYLTHFRFNPWEHLAVFALPLDASPHFLLPGYEEAGTKDALPTGTVLHMFPEVGSDREAFAEFITSISDARRVAICRHKTSANVVERFETALERDLADCSTLISDLRSVKNQAEIEMISEACRIGDRAIRIMIDEHLRPGAIEADLGGELSRILRQEGADGSAFEPGVTGGWRSALPHGPDHSRRTGTRPGRDAIEAGELLVFDFSVIAGGYVSDHSRVYVMGESESRQREILKVVLEAQRAGLDACQPGEPVAGVDRAAKSVIEKAGFADCSPQKSGHDLGVELHERPYVAAISDEILLPGMVFALEPAIYLSGYGGARVEDVVVIEEGGPRVLTDMSNQVELELKA